MRVETAVKWGALGSVAAVTYNIYGPAAAAKLAMRWIGKAILLSSASVFVGMRFAPKRKRISVTSTSPEMQRKIDNSAETDFTRRVTKASRRALAVLSPFYSAMEIMNHPGSILEKLAHPLLELSGSYWLGIPYVVGK